MWSAVRDRLGVYRAILALGYRWLVATPFAVLGAGTFIRDEFFAPETQARLKASALLSWLPEWPWEWWALGGALAVILLILEGAYRQQATLRRQLKEAMASADRAAFVTQPRETDHELTRIRLGIRRLKDTLLGYGDPSFQQASVEDTLKLVEDSQHMIWSDEHTWELRKDFIHFARTLNFFRVSDGLAFSKRNYSNLEAALKEATAKLESELPAHSPK